jgi:enoyl-[acyl-carrier protein] reductase I
MGFLEGKRALVVGVASKRSIAWGIAKTLKSQGAEVAFTYQNERLRERIEDLAAECGSNLVVPCNVESDAEIEAVFEHLDDFWDHLDILVHSVAFAPREQLEGDFLDTISREGFRIAHDISSYSFAALAKAGRQMLQGRHAALLTLTYLGAERMLPNYNVMGLAKASLEANTRYLAYALGPEGMRVNAISAGPVRTLAAAGISDFRKILDYVASTAPLRRNVTIEEIGNVAAFLCSDLASAITGEVIFVDNGFSHIGMPEPV